MSKEKEEEGKLIAGNFDSSIPPVGKPMTEAEQMRQQKIQRKRAEVELADYKKRLRSSNELKEMQTHELELGIAYFNAKVEFRALKPKMDELDALEDAENKEAKKKQREEYEVYMKEQEEKKAKKEKEKKPLIIQSGGGIPRSKE